MASYSQNKKQKTQCFPDKWEVCHHPFELFFIPPNADKLVIGTFPTYHKNYQATFNFFYGGETNPFWEVFGKVYNKQFKHYAGELAVKERKQLLIDNKVGITDMLKICYRKNGSSKDQDLYPIDLNDVFDLLDKNTCISRLILTSRTEVYGALGLLETYFLQKGLELKKGKIRPDKIMETNFDYLGRNIQVLIPYSTSPTNTHSTPELLFEMYKYCLE